MKNRSASLLVFLTLAVLALQNPAAHADTSGPTATEVHKMQWPRTFQDGSTTLQMYQPDIEKWEGNAFQARSAVSVQTAGQQAPSFGVIWLTARTDVDKDAGIVTLSNIQITKANFPADPTKADAYLAVVRAHIPANPVLVPLSQIDNSYLLSSAVKKADAQPVQNNPPTIIFSSEPALLLLIGGDPVMRPVSQTNYQRVFNTNALILQGSQGGAFYARALGYWFKADALAGPWAAETDLPPGLANAGKTLVADKQVDPIDPPQGQDKPAMPPVLYVSTTPAELVQTSGKPEFVPIPQTNLLEVQNSANAIILDINTQSYYVLISGRWFTSKIGATPLSGPWSFIAGSALPPDFAQIPPNSDKANVLVSVPNTPQAQEAVIANSIPQTATVKRSEANLTVSYDGAPQFIPIQDTSLQYAVNTALPVIEVTPSSYYSVANGIWFTAAAPVGPWTVATSVPPIIYTIPVAAPVHYVTYVRVYGYTPDVVYVGYTPGYYGTIITADGTVVYGTGYYYPPYVGTTVYVAQPATYGYGASFADGAATGFGFGFIAGLAVGALLEPHWGCWGWGGGWGNTYNVNINNGNVYNHWGGNTVVNHNSGWNGNHWSSGTRAAGFNPYNGNGAAGRTGGTYNPNTGRAFGGTTTASGNAYTGNWNANQNRDFDNTKTGANAQSHTTASGNAYTGNYNSTTTRSGTTADGAKAAGVKTTSGNTYTGQQSTDRTGAAYNPNTGNGAAWHDGNVYTDNNGNVYRHSDDGGYQNYTNQGWQNTQRTNDNASQFQHMDQQSQGWDRGNQRFQNGGGGRWGGGGGGGDRRR